MPSQTRRRSGGGQKSVNIPIRTFVRKDMSIIESLADYAHKFTLKLNTLTNADVWQQQRKTNQTGITYKKNYTLTAPVTLTHGKFVLVLDKGTMIFTERHEKFLVNNVIPAHHYIANKAERRAYENNMENPFYSYQRGRQTHWALIVVESMSVREEGGKKIITLNNELPPIEM